MMQSKYVSKYSLVFLWVGLLALLLGLPPTDSSSAKSVMLTCDVLLDGTGSHATIQSAVDDIACDIVNIGSGTFNENVVIARDVIIQGQGKTSTTVDGSVTDSVLRVSSGTNVTIEHLRITNGKAQWGGGIFIENSKVSITSLSLEENKANEITDINYVSGGSAIYCSGGSSEVAVTNSDLSMNFGGLGGAIYVINCYLSLENVTISNNEGGIFFDQGGTLIMNNSALVGNTSFSGGGLLNSFGEVSISGSTISDNSANFMDGGGIFNGGVLTISDSKIVRNSAVSTGGAIFNQGTLTVTDSLFAENRAGFQGGAIAIGDQLIDTTTDIRRCSLIKNIAANGAAIYQSGGKFTLVNTTIGANDDDDQPEGAAYYGGFGLGTADILNSTIANNKSPGIYTSDGNVVTLMNTIVASNQDSDCTGSGKIESAGNNIDSDGSCSLTTLTDFPIRNPLLGPLGDNGGSTWTYAPLSISPAVDTGDDLECPSTDQRRIARPFDGLGDGLASCDIGAHEYDGPPPMRAFLPGVIREE